MVINLLSSTFSFIKILSCLNKFYYLFVVKVVGYSVGEFHDLCACQNLVCNVSYMK